jgi:hypothetical protein
LVRDRYALESGSDVLVVQMEPRKSGEELRASFLLFLGGTILINSAIGVEGCGNLGVSRRQSSGRFFSK